MGKGGHTPTGGDKHERFEGPIHVVGPAREGWAFFSACGLRSALYPTEADTREAMREHRVAPAEEPRRRRLLGRRQPERWPGWPHDRRHAPSGLGVS